MNRGHYYWSFLLASSISIIVWFYFGYPHLMNTILSRSSVGVHTQTASIIDATDPNLVGYWPLDDGTGATATDASITQDNGTFTGTPTWTAGNVGTGAAQFDGSSYISIPDNASFHFGTSVPFSVSLWVKTTAVSGIILDTTTQTHAGYSIGYVSGKGVYMDLRLYNDATSVITDCTIGAASGQTTVNDGQWHHIVVVVNRNPTCGAGDIVIYVDHAPEDGYAYYYYEAATNQNVTSPNPDPILLGAFDNFGTIAGTFTGALDDVRIYNRILTDPEINQLYQIGSVGANPCTNNSCTAASCSLTDVATAVSLVSDGGKVLVPAGICTWNSTLSLTRTITLQGAGTSTGGTEIDYGGSQHALIDAEMGAKTGKLDISGFRFYGGDSMWFDGTAIRFDGPVGWKNLRIHDNVFSWTQVYSIKGHSYTDGLIDHNIFEGAAKSGGIELNGAGLSDWTKPIALGSDDYFFVENNAFNFGEDQGSTGHVAVDYVNGGRVVFRNNYVQNGLFETHDTTRGGPTVVSSDAFEVYDNTFYSTSEKWEGINVSSGTGVIWGNTFSGTWDHPIGGLDYKTSNVIYNNGVLPCDGNDPLDQNTPGQTGWRCQYQLGTQNYGPSAISVPVYIWGNTNIDTESPVNFEVTSPTTHLQEGRDYFNGTPEPGYTPFQYPHPIVTGVTPVIYGMCGPAAKTYAAAESFPQGNYCSSGTVNPSSPSNPTQGISSSWTCSAGTAVSCMATRSAPDHTPPVISSITNATITDSSVTITWSTDKQATSTVDYGLTSAYGNTTGVDPNLVSLHSITFTNLSANTQYHYRISASDASGDLATSSDQTFATLATVVVPVIVPTYSSGGGGSYSPAPVLTPVVTTATTTHLVSSSTKMALPAASISSNTHYTVITSSLYVGLSSPQVTTLQNILVQEGFVAPQYVTGYYGTITESAVAAFQTKYNIVSRGSPETTGLGLVGVKTRTLINSFIQNGKYTSGVVITSPRPTTVSTVISIPPNGVALATSSVSRFFTTSLALGSAGSDVKKLQVFLNQHGFFVALSGAGSVGQETIYFSTGTKNALMRFQSAHAAAILAPYGLTVPTGYFGPATMKVVNSLL